MREKTGKEDGNLIIDVKRVLDVVLHAFRSI